MDTHIRGQDRAEYLKGDSWKCSSSPTGAHHWIIRRQTICKYCLTTKQIKDTQPDKDTVTHTATA